MEGGLKGHRKKARSHSLGGFGERGGVQWRRNNGGWSSAQGTSGRRHLVIAKYRVGADGQEWVIAYKEKMKTKWEANDLIGDRYDPPRQKARV